MTARATYPPLPMLVIACFTYAVAPGRMGDFLAKLGQAAAPAFDSPSMPRSVRLYRGTAPEPGTDRVVLHIEYDDMAAYEARTAFENANPAWRALFDPQPDSPERLVSTEVLTEFDPQSAA